MKYAIGIDIGGTITKIGLVSEQGKCLEKTSFRTKEFKNPYGGATLITKVEKAAAAIGKGEISISDDGSTVTIESCKESEGCKASSTEDRLVGEVIID